MALLGEDVDLHAKRPQGLAIVGGDRRVEAEDPVDRKDAVHEVPDGLSPGAELDLLLRARARTVPPRHDARVDRDLEDVAQQRHAALGDHPGVAGPAEDLAPPGVLLVAEPDRLAALEVAGHLAGLLPLLLLHVAARPRANHGRVLRRQGHLREEGLPYPELHAHAHLPHRPAEVQVQELQGHLVGLLHERGLGHLGHAVEVGHELALVADLPDDQNRRAHGAEVAEGEGRVQRELLLEGTICQARLQGDGAGAETLLADGGVEVGHLVVDRDLRLGGHDGDVQLLVEAMLPGRDAAVRDEAGLVRELLAGTLPLVDAHHRVEGADGGGDDALGRVDAHPQGDQVFLGSPDGMSMIMVVLRRAIRIGGDLIDRVERVFEVRRVHPNRVAEGARSVAQLRQGLHGLERLGRRGHAALGRALQALPQESVQRPPELRLDPPVLGIMRRAATSVP
mmetsp:Transcript_35009/g.104009  ORF Transcript_35009/g.104009 Transcript_35009/m.104009 type:complete len:452 (+) Transcript_35009:4527-5882(+)